MSIYYMIPLYGNQDGSLTGFPERLPLDADTPWVNGKYFNSREKQKIKSDLKAKAKSQFNFPEQVIEEMIEALMSSNRITPDGFLKVPNAIASLPIIYINFNNINYYFHEGQTHRLLDFIRNELNQILSEKQLEINQGDRKVANLCTVMKVNSSPHFLSAFRKSKFDSEREFWEEERLFSLESDDEIVKKVQDGTFHFLSCK